MLQLKLAKMATKPILQVCTFEVSCRSELALTARLEFLYTLDRNLEDVDTFYNKKYAETSRRIKLLRDRYGSLSTTPEGVDQDEVEDLVGALLEIRGQLRKLQWYGDVNRRGFVKITKKLDKKIPTNPTQQRYLATKVDPKSFATNFQLSQDLRAVNDWLSLVVDVRAIDDTSSAASTPSLKRVSSQSILSLPPGLLDTVEQAIKNDDAALLAELLLEANTEHDDNGTVFQRLLLNLLQRSISCRSKRCIESLLHQIHSLDEDGDVNKRNCIHRLIIAIGRAKINEAQQQENSSTSSWLDSARYIQPAEHPVTTPRHFGQRENGNTKPLAKDDPPVKLLTYLLNNLRIQQRTALQTRDLYGRTPLHYAAQ